MNTNIFLTFPTIIIDDKYVMRQPTTSESDIMSMNKIYTDPQVICFVPDGCIPQGMDGARDEAKYYSNFFLFQKSVYWFVARRDTNEAIGTCGFCTWDRYNSRLEIAYNIRSEYHNQGIMTKVISQAIEFGFMKMGALRIQAQLDPANVVSIHLLGKLGFKADGLLRSYRLYKNDKHVDVLMMSKLSTDA